MTKEETEKNAQILALQDDWKKQISTKTKIMFQDDGKEYSPADYFAGDGFFPGYFSQNKKILFVGRETRWISGQNFVDTSIHFFENDNVNKSTFWCKVLYMLYGIQHEGKVPYSEVPQADTIAKEMVKNNDYGFAIMNLSKYSNDSDGGANRNVYMMNRFLEDSELEKKNFFLEELSILDPDIIITANLWKCGVKEEYLDLCFPNNNFKTWKTDESRNIDYGDFELNGKTVKLINTYHFSAYNKSIEDCFYNPVMKILFPKK